MHRHRLAVMLVASIAPAPALAGTCKVEKLAELPVTLAGHQAMITAQFGGRDARFIVDSGAFHSALSQASAAEFGLRTEPAPAWFRVSGVGGDAAVSVAVATNFSLAGIPIRRTDFVVGGSDTGSAGLIGQNILGLADVEYDLPHGVVRLMRTHDCGNTSLAYWAGDKPVTTIRLERSQSVFKPLTIGTVQVNGAKVRAVFDTGAGASLLSLSAAKRAGVTPTSPGVEPDGYSSGMGSRRLPTWLATFDKIDIGGEAISKPKIRITDLDFARGDMLIGIDFFLTHRVFVSNTDAIMYVTYEGGPLFGLSPKGARTAEGTALDLTDKAGDPANADGFARRAAVQASNSRLDAALADFDKAVAMAPTDARFVYQRAMLHLARHEPQLAREDLDKTIALAPNDAEAYLRRAQLRANGPAPEDALDDVKAADRLFAQTADQRLTIASLYNTAGKPEAAIGNYDLWLKSHPADSSRPGALNGRCWSRGLANSELDKALADCNAALRLVPASASFLDSRALVRLRRGETALAIADYDAALAIAPKMAWSLYARGIAEDHAGKAAQAASDRAAAIAIDPKVAERARRFKID